MHHKRKGPKSTETCGHLCTDRSAECEEQRGHKGPHSEGTCQWEDNEGEWPVIYGADRADSNMAAPHLLPQGRILFEEEK